MNKSGGYLIHFVSVILLIILSVKCDKPDSEPAPDPCGSSHHGPGYNLLCWATTPSDGAIVNPSKLTIIWQTSEYATSSLFLGTDKNNLQFITEQKSQSYEVSNLEPGKTYYWFVSVSMACRSGCSTQVRAFTTAPDANLPYVITSPVITHQKIPPRAGGNVMFEGSSKVYESGIYYGTSPNPEIRGPKFQMESGPGKYSVLLTGLNPNTTYYVKAYTTNDSGTSLGSEVSFTTGQNTDYRSINDADGNTYYIINIGNQVWMAENLRTTKFNDGTPIAPIEDNYAWETSTLPAYCWYNNNIGFKSTYGALYNWYAIDSASNGHKNVCPAGWHIPTDSEWIGLTSYLGGESSAGIKLKETGDYYWFHSANAGDNSSEFSALPAGQRFDKSSSLPDRTSTPFFYMDDIAAWWSNTSTIANHWLEVTAEKSGAEKFPSLKNTGHSIRCLKDSK